MKVITDNGQDAILPDRYADAIAENLAGDYPGTTSAMVREHLAKPADDRDIIGMWAYGMLESNGLIPD